MGVLADCEANLEVLLIKHRIVVAEKVDAEDVLRRELLIDHQRDDALVALPDKVALFGQEVWMSS